MAKTKDKTATGPRARNDAYVMMLFITFVAIVTGTVLMYLDHDEYGKTPPPPAPKIGEIDNTKSGSAVPPAPPTPPAPAGGGVPKGDAEPKT